MRDPHGGSSDLAATDGEHLDSCYDSGEQRRRVTALLYLNTGWQAAHAGGLRVWAARERCWREVMPVADEIVLLRSDRTWHRVHEVAPEAPSAGRLALTCFLFGRFAPGRG